MHLPRCLLLLACLGSGVHVELRAQDATRVGLRAGAGVDATGRPVYTGQIEVTDLGSSHSVEIALGAFEGRRDEVYRAESRLLIAGQIVTTHDYSESTRTRGLGLIGTLLLRHGLRSGPYLALGMGLGPVHVDWRRESPTDARLGTTLSGGGSFAVESGVVLGTLLAVGIGQRLLDRLDVRAQMTTLLTPATKQREDMKLVPAFTLTTGVRL